MRGLNVHKNIPVSVTKLTLGLRVGVINSHLIADKLFPANLRAITGPPKMSCTKNHACIDHQTKVYPCYAHGWPWLVITSNQQGKMFVQNLNRIVRMPNVTPRQFPYCTTDSIPIDVMFQENFPTHTQVWNCLSHRNDCRHGGVIWLTYWCYNSPDMYDNVRNILRLCKEHSHQKIKCSITCMGWAESKAATPWWFVVIEPYHSWWWPFKSPIKRKEGQTSSACTAAIDASKQSKIQSPRSGLWYRLCT